MSKKRNFLIMLIAIVLISSAIIWFFNRSKDFSTSMVVGCKAENYFEQESVGYFTVTLDGSSNVTKELKINDIELQKQLLNANLNDIIGISIIMTIPTKELKEAYPNSYYLESFNLLYDTSQYDDYIIVTDIFLDS